MTDYKDTVYLPKTDFSMRAGLPNKEPQILKIWEDTKLFKKLREQRKNSCLLYTSPSPRDATLSRMPSSA